MSIYATNCDLASYPYLLVVSAKDMIEDMLRGYISGETLLQSLDRQASLSEDICDTVLCIAYKTGCRLGNYGRKDSAVTHRQFVEMFEKTNCMNPFSFMEEVFKVAKEYSEITFRLCSLQQRCSLMNTSTYPSNPTGEMLFEIMIHRVLGYCQHNKNMKLIDVLSYLFKDKTELATTYHIRYFLYKFGKEFHQWADSNMKRLLSVVECDGLLSPVMLSLTIERLGELEPKFGFPLEIRRRIVGILIRALQHPDPLVRASAADCAAQFLDSAPRPDDDDNARIQRGEPSRGPSAGIRWPMIEALEQRLLTEPNPNVKSAIQSSLDWANAIELCT